MASDTMGGFGITQIVRERAELLTLSSYVMRRTNGTDLQIGLLCGEVGETFPDIDLSTEGDDGFLGYVSHPVHPTNTFDIDTAFGDNEWVWVLLPHGGQLVISAFLQAQSGGAEDAKAGEWLAIGDQDDGYLQPMSDKYADAAVATDTIEEGVGRAYKTISNAHATEFRLILLRY